MVVIQRACDRCPVLLSFCAAGHTPALSHDVCHSVRQVARPLSRVSVVRCCCHSVRQVTCQYYHVTGVMRYFYSVRQVARQHCHVQVSCVVIILCGRSHASTVTCRCHVLLSFCAADRTPALSRDGCHVLSFCVAVARQLCHVRCHVLLSSYAAGHTPALSCAPSLRVADCLAMILANMPYPATANNNTITYSRYSGNGETVLSIYCNSYTLSTSICDDGHGLFYFCLTHQSVFMGHCE